MNFSPEQWDYCPIGKKVLTTSEARNEQERQWASDQPICGRANGSGSTMCARPVDKDRR